MTELRYRKFTGVDGPDAHTQLAAALADGSFPVSLLAGGLANMWMTHEEVIPGAMQQSYFVLHVTAWVEDVHAEVRDG